ncbi:hypothetical protein FA95DRAFT_1481404 [Auriscalpium vulgare]|uniref:Uncharacterized protein n=1 Tax=Auriscalpium vulgare TaxID=40419 RepID=A0ACB8SBM6_9AGAM|nr:hypothetical protein FA95DRAFT_1481404 [Auriscalpium vulgare]
MSPKPPLLGSLAVQGPSLAPQVVHVSSATCQNLSLFKDLLREYRKLDDSITMRLNRTTAQFRDRDRLGAGGKGSVQDQACAYLWKDLVDNWRRRTEIINYCVLAVDRSMDEKQRSLAGTDVSSSEKRRIQSDLFAEDVKRKHVHNELSVEKIVRQRSVDAFTSRCRYFQPPLSDAEARQWWDAARSRQ